MLARCALRKDYWTGVIGVALTAIQFHLSRFRISARLIGIGPGHGRVSESISIIETDGRIHDRHAFTTAAAELEEC